MYNMVENLKLQFCEEIEDTKIQDMEIQRYKIGNVIAFGFCISCISYLRIFHPQIY